MDSRFHENDTQTATPCHSSVFTGAGSVKFETLVYFMPFAIVEAKVGYWFKKMTIGSLPDESARKFGGREALYFNGNRWSFAQVAKDVDRAAKTLIQLGIQPGDEVDLWGPNRPVNPSKREE